MTGRIGYRGRRLCRRHRHGDGGFPGDRRAARHGADRRPTALLWKMADEPVLCFDGDSAGHRAAYRAVDLALPRLEPGKSLKFATAARRARTPTIWCAPAAARRWRKSSPRRGRLPRCCGRARPKARRSTRRSAARRSRHASTKSPLRSAMTACANITGRISTRACRQFFAPAQARAAISSAPERSRTVGAARRPGQAPAWRAARQPLGATMPYVVVSQQLALKPGASRPRTARAAARGADPAGGAQPPLAAARPPGRIGAARIPPCRRRAAQGRADRHRRTCRRRRDAEALRGSSPPQSCETLLARIDGAITTPSVWGARPDAAPDDVLVTWSQLVALHRQWHHLTKELKDAEQALGQDASEGNYLRLRDVKARLSNMDGTEALIEGFGASSGRGARQLMSLRLR